jgi:YD repeat-containing protein
VVGALVANGPLGLLVAVHDRNTAVTEYVYVPSATLTSMHDALVTSDVGEVPQAGLGLEPKYLCT